MYVYVLKTAAGHEVGFVGVHDGRPASFNRETWLLEEYKLLSQHYFHEDSQLLRTVALYGAINGALLAFLGSKFAETATMASRVIPIIGLVLCFSWTATLIRRREWRNYIESRIEDIEREVHGHFGSEEPAPLDIRTLRNWRTAAPRKRWSNWLYRSLREVPASYVLLTLPAAFSLVWIGLGATLLQRMP